MLQLHKKTKGFTIAEMLVVLVISSIIITITLLVLNLVQRQIQNIQANMASNTEQRLLERGLWQDFNSHNLFYNDKEQQVFCMSEKDTIIYTFHKAYVLRNLDTLAIAVFNKKVFLEGEEVLNQRIDALELQISKEITNRKIVVFKTNDAAHYMNY